MKYKKAACLIFLFGSIPLPAMEETDVEKLEFKKNNNNKKTPIKILVDVRHKIAGYTSHYNISFFKSDPNTIKLLEAYHGGLHNSYYPKNSTITRTQQNNGNYSFLEAVGNTTVRSFMDHDNRKRTTTTSSDFNQPTENKNDSSDKYDEHTLLFEAVDKKIKQLEQEKTDDTFCTASKAAQNTQDEQK